MKENDSHLSDVFMFCVRTLCDVHFYRKNADLLAGRFLDIFLEREELMMPIHHAAIMLLFLYEGLIIGHTNFFSSFIYDMRNKAFLCGRFFVR